MIFIPYNTVGYLIFFDHALFRSRKTNCKPSGAVSLIEGICLRSSETRPDGVSFFFLKCSIKLETGDSPTRLGGGGEKERREGAIKSLKFLRRLAGKGNRSLVTHV